MQSGFQIRVALTGGTGFVGRHLIDELLDCGYQVKALVRPHHYLGEDTSGVEWIRGSLESRASLEKLMDGADFVIHLAGLVKGVHYEEFAKVNVSGTGCLVDTLQSVAPRSKLLLLSSLAARHPDLSHYACSKRSGEILLENSALSDWTIFRPTAIYGPGDTELLPLFRLIGRGIKPVIGMQKGQISLLYLEDLVEAIKSWLIHSSQASGKYYELADSHLGSYTWQMIGDIINQQAGHKLPLSVPVPAAALLAASKINHFCARWLRYQPMLTPGKVREILHSDWRCDLNDIHRDLGWVPSYPLAKGLQAMLNWQ